MKRKSAILFLLLSMMSVVTGVLADCRHNGKDYPVGTVIKGMVCTKDGWQKL